MKFRSVAAILIVVIPVCSLSACSLFSAEKKPEMQLASVGPSAPAVIASEPQKPPQQKEFIEVVWQIPDEKVDSYVIRYGTDPEHLDTEVHLKPEDAQKIQHERYGEVFRFLIANPPHEQTVYVTIAAISDGHESAPTHAFEVAPSVTTPTPVATPTTEMQ